jgi:hypothetical protein
MGAGVQGRNGTLINADGADLILDQWMLKAVALTKEGKGAQAEQSSANARNDNCLTRLD